MTPNAEPLLAWGRAEEDSVNDVIRIGLVGCGRIMPAHLRGYLRLWEAGYQNFRITALCARKMRDAESFRQRGEGPPPRPPCTDDPHDPLGAPHMYVSDLHEGDVQCYDDYETMIREAPIDAVDVYASVFTHHQIGLPALQAGKHLMVEKPFAVSIKAGRLLVEEAEQRGLSLGVAENAHYSEGTRRRALAVQGGAIGEVQMYVQAGVGNPLWGPDKIVADTAWRHRKLEAGGGISLDLGAHIFNVVREICGEIDTVTGYAETFEPVRYRRDEAGNILETVECDADDAFFADFRFANGGMGHVSIAWAGRGQATGLPMGNAIFGSQGSIQGDTITYTDGATEKLADWCAANVSAQRWDELFPLGVTDAFALEKHSWLEGIVNGRDPETSGKEGLRDIAVCFGVLESNALGRAVSVAEVESGAVCEYQQEIDERYGLS